VGHAVPLHSAPRRKVLVLLLALSTLVATWLTSQAMRPEPTPENLAEALLDKASRSEGNRISTEAPDMWVTFENHRPISNTNILYRHKMTCIIEEGGQVVIERIEDRRFLLRYHPAHRGSGASCPEGTLFYLATTQEALLHHAP
jgi:hypothetical protein